MIFEWDHDKAVGNLKKHRVSFQEAAEVFNDPLAASISDTTHSTDESRFITIRRSAKGRILLVIYNERGESLRIISARLATRQEIRIYEETKI
ncbi:MAG TPA: BrnT family toxin [Blastocatellia bacterium]|nr:BrnT family toxin [Blastocatellia bacterium]